MVIANNRYSKTETIDTYITCSAKVPVVTDQRVWHIDTPLYVHIPRIIGAGVVVIAERYALAETVQSRSATPVIHRVRIMIVAGSADIAPDEIGCTCSGITSTNETGTAIRHDLCPGADSICTDIADGTDIAVIAVCPIGHRRIDAANP